MALGFESDQSHARNDAERSEASQARNVWAWFKSERSHVRAASTVASRQYWIERGFESDQSHARNDAERSEASQARTVWAWFKSERSHVAVASNSRADATGRARI